jgi:hypothetical protein
MPFLPGKERAMAKRGMKFRHKEHSYRVVFVESTRYMVTPWLENRRKYAYAVADFRIITNPDFTLSFDFWVYAPNLDRDSDRRFDGITTLRDALIAAATLIERQIDPR